MKPNQDILIQLKDNEIEELAQLYEPHRQSFHLIYSFLQTCIKSKTIRKMSDFVQIYSPRNSWREDGSFVASMPAHGHDFVAHSLDPSGRNLIDGLKHTKRFHFYGDSSRDYSLFHAIHEQFSSKIAETFQSFRKYDVIVEEVGMWALDRDEALKFQSEDWSLPDVYIKEIQPSDVPLINSVWPHRYQDSVNKHLDWLKLGIGYGIYLKSNGKLVSWVKTSCLGQLCALQTLDEYKRKGYAVAVTKRMSSEMAKTGLDPCALVTTGNVPSERLFENLGYKKEYNCNFIEVYAKK